MSGMELACSHGETEDLGGADRRLYRDLLNLVYLKVGGSVTKPVLRDAAWEALGVGPHDADRIARALYDRGLLVGDPDTFGLPEGSWFWWVTPVGTEALRAYFGVWDVQAEREVRLRAFAYACEHRPVTLRRELGDGKADQLAQLVVEMRGLGEGQPARVAAIGRNAKDLLSGAEGDSVERVRAFLEVPSLVARVHANAPG